MTACPTGKRRYASQIQADKVLGRIWRRVKPGRRLESRTYPCQLCGGYHLTSQARRKDTR